MTGIDAEPEVAMIRYEPIQDLEEAGRLEHCLDVATRLGLDREHVHPARVEEALELADVALGRRARRQPQSDAERRVRAHPALDGERVALEIAAHLGPRLARVDVRAVRQVRVADLHGARPAIA